jgi:hypothetical protein
MYTMTMPAASGAIIAMNPSTIINTPSAMDQPEARLIPPRTASVMIPPYVYVWAQTDAGRAKLNNDSKSEERN